MRLITARFLTRKRCTDISYAYTTRRCSIAAFSSHAADDVGTAAGGADGPHLPVLIVGAGPVGLVLSMLLTKFGINCAVVEKTLTFSRHPQAHFINNRSMEIFRKLDGLAEDIERLQPPVNLWRKFIYCTSLSGSILGSVDHMQPQDFDKIISPVSVAHFSQYKLVSLLLKKLQNLGVHVYSPDSLDSSAHSLQWEKKILMGHECTSIQLTDKGVTISVSVQNGGKIEKRRINCNILVGCDGASSMVRKLTGIEMRGERDLQKLVSVHFLSRDLGRYLSFERPGMLFFVFNTEAIGVFVAHDLNQGEFVLQLPYYPPQQNFEDFSPQVCEGIISNLAGWDPSDLQVLDIKPWTMHAEVAENYVTYKNRVILVGDAAHRFPPAGGFGMNTGIQDAHNLAWKIYYLLNGFASTSIIRTYESERRPIALANTALSMENFNAAISIPSALGLDPAVANSVHKVINSKIGSVIPKSIQKVVLEGIFSVGRAQLSDYILNEKNPLGTVRLAKLKSIFEEGKSLQLQFPAEDLGFCYKEGALVTDARDEPQNTKTTSYKRGSRDYIPSCKPGSRLPHMQVRLLDPASAEITLSTLDLVSGDKPEFLLIISPLIESYNIARATLKKAEECKVHLKVCVIWPNGSSVNKNFTGSLRELEPYENYVDVEELEGLSEKSWWQLCSLTNKGVILVRPDEHIAWRVESDTVGDPVLEADRVFSTILGF